VDRRPGKLSLDDLLLPLVEGAELLVVLIEVPEQVLERLNDILINPGSVLQLDHDVEHIDHREALHALIVFLQVLPN